MLLLGLAPWAVGILVVAFLAVCVLMILTVLIQKPQGGGLSGAFGAGASSGQTAFGAKTGDALTIFTIIVFVAFLGLAIGLNYATRPSAITTTAPAAISNEPATAPPAETTPGATTPAGDTGVPAGGQPPVTTPATDPNPVDPAAVTPPQPTQPEQPAPATPESPATGGGR